MKKLFILLVVPALLFSSCCCKKGKTCGTKNKDKSAVSSEAYAYATPENIASVLPGEWSWVKTNCCGRTASWRTPLTEGYTASILFTPEKAEHFKNGKSESSAPYTLTYFEEGPKDKIAYQEQDGRKAMIRMSSDTLVIDYGYMDLQTEYYVRKK